jgi:hypothetical protein
MAFVRCYVVLAEVAALAVTLWIVHTHALAMAEVTPYLHITAAEKRSGKTRLLEVLSVLVARPWFTVRTTAAALVRKLATEPPPTLLLDESDAAFRSGHDYAEQLRGILNAGYRRGGKTTLLEKVGGNWVTKDLVVFGPKAIAGIGKLPDTVADRSIRILLRRRTPNEHVLRFRWREAEALGSPLKGRLCGWLSTRLPALADARPDIPSELDDRAAEVWEPLLAIADEAGGDWPQRARQAARALSAGRGWEDDSLRVRLLGDIRAAFKELDTDRLPSEELVKVLVALEEAPWGDLKGKPLDTRALARLLKPHEVRPHQVRFGDKTLKGYELADFADAWGRYLPPESETRETNETDWKPII